MEEKNDGENHERRLFLARQSGYECSRDGLSPILVGYSIRERIECLRGYINAKLPNTVNLSRAVSFPRALGLAYSRTKTPRAKFGLSAAIEMAVDSTVGKLLG